MHTARGQGKHVNKEGTVGGEGTQTYVKDIHEFRCVHCEFACERVSAPGYPLNDEDEDQRKDSNLRDDTNSKWRQ